MSKKIDSYILIDIPVYGVSKESDYEYKSLALSVANKKATIETNCSIKTSLALKSINKLCDIIVMRTMDREADDDKFILISVEEFMKMFDCYKVKSGESDESGTIIESAEEFSKISNNSINEEGEIEFEISTEVKASYKTFLDTIDDKDFQKMAIKTKRRTNRRLRLFSFISRFI